MEKIFPEYNSLVKQTELLKKENQELNDKLNSCGRKTDELIEMLNDYGDVCKNVGNLDSMLSNYGDICKNIGNLNSMLSNYGDICKNIGNLNSMLNNYGDICKNIGNLNSMLNNYGDICKNIGNLNSMLNNYGDIYKNIGNLNNSYQKIISDNERMDFDINRLKKHLKSRQNSAETTPAPSDAPVSADDYSSIDYLDFENHFRGMRELIIERQRMYLPYFKGKKNVLDFGCGRGEFLELMKKEGIHAVGAETYSDYVDYCTERGLEVYHRDGLSYLKSMEKPDGIFLGQVIEHLTIDQIVELTETAYEKLDEGGVIIMETPNPCSLSIYTNAFYIDPSHNKPVHPKTMEYLLHKAGFARSNISVVFTECSRPKKTIPELDGYDRFNAAMKDVENMLYGSQDYAVIAVK